MEPFYGGSHRQLADLLAYELLAAENVPCELVTLPARKWHWRLMASSLHFAAAIPRSGAIRVLFATSMVNLAEMLGLRPDLNSRRVRKILYFHENQLTYPVQRGEASGKRKVAAEDFQIGWAQVLSCLAADQVVFNSNFNCESFLGRVGAFINTIPEQQLRQREVADQIRRKSRVLYFPVTISSPVIGDSNVSPSLAHSIDTGESKPLTILWNHRWEYDKNPDEFFRTLFELDESGIPFRVVVLGESYSESPPVFEQARDKLAASRNCTVLHWGYAPTRERYLELLRESDVVVSTSNHEFFGVAVVEAVLCGCYPLVPNRLVYPELFPRETLFSTQRQLLKRLRYFCRNPHAAKKFFGQHIAAFARFTWQELRPQFKELLLPAATNEQTNLE